jgi:hypothetical protein
MLFNTIKAICISLLLIALIHYLYAFFKDTLTVPKIKDLVNKPAKRYDEMFDIMSNNRPQQNIESQAMQGQAMQDQAMQGQAMQGQAMQGQAMQGQHMQGQHMQGQAMQGQSMQEELKNFLNELKKPEESKFNKKYVDFAAANDISSGPYTPF